MELTHFTALKILLNPHNFDTECIDSKHVYNSEENYTFVPIRTSDLCTR